MCAGSAVAVGVMAGKPFILGSWWFWESPVVPPPESEGNVRNKDVPMDAAPVASLLIATEEEEGGNKEEVDGKGSTWREGRFEALTDSPRCDQEAEFIFYVWNKRFTFDVCHENHADYALFRLTIRSDYGGVDMNTTQLIECSWTETYRLYYSKTLRVLLFLLFGW